MPQCRLYPLEGAAACERALCRGRGRICRDGHQGRTRSRPCRHARLQGPGRQRQCRRRRVPPEEEQDRPLPGNRAHRGAGHSRGHLHQWREAGGGGQGDRHRHGIGGDEPARDRHRREAHPLLDRRACTAGGAEADGRDRRGLYRARARLGVVALGQRRHSGRDARSRDAGARRRGGEAAPAHAGHARSRLQARHQGRRRR